MCGRPLKKIVIQIAAAAAMPLPQPAHAETSTLSDLCCLFAHTRVRQQNQRKI